MNAPATAPGGVVRGLAGSANCTEISGDTDWFTKPMLPSYHTVWFEMHEDLLSTLGIERGSESA